MNASRIEQIFLSALDISLESDRVEYLRESCVSDPELRQQIEKLLEAHQQLGNFLDMSSLDNRSANSNPVEAVGTSIGPYVLVQMLGEGGMGTVYLAEQRSPVRRRTALKLLRSGMDSHQVVRRFQAERQSLALMDHPNIAKVLDAGTTSNGRPYFVMELVDGIPMTRYCDEHQLTIRERLALFLPVCHAIQHAHQKGVIHRDIKPSNLLVTTQDAQPVPKVIDFGVAKVLERDMSDESIHTEIGQIIGTLEYMSPEQAGASTLDIDTRADIFSLGVLLHELLIGESPLDGQRIRTLPLPELLRIIRYEEPRKLSDRLVNSPASLVERSALRRTDTSRFIRQVRGDLDWIVMRCLEKDRNRRYQTASELARDIERYLKDEPVDAGPPSWRYQMSKFARRHRAVMAMVSMTAVILIVATGVSVWQAGLARRSASLANAAKTRESNQRLIAEQQQRKAQRAEQEARRALNAEAAARKQAWAALDTLTDDVVEQLLVSKPILDDDDKAFLRRVAELYEPLLQSASNEADTESKRVAALTQARLGRIHGTLGDDPSALQAMQHAERLLSDLLTDSPELRIPLAEVRSSLASHLANSGNVAAAIDMMRNEVKELEAYTSRYSDDMEAKGQLATACLNLVLRIDFARNPTPEALRECEALTLKALGHFEARVKTPETRTMNQKHELYLSSCYNNLGVIAHLRQDVDNAAKNFQLATELRKQLAERSPDDPETQLYLAKSLWNWAELETARHNNQVADSTYLKAIEAYEIAVRLAPGHPSYRHELARRLAHYADWLRFVGDRPGESLGQFERALNVLAVNPPPGAMTEVHRNIVADIQSRRASTLDHLGRADEADTAWEELNQTLPQSESLEFQIRRAHGIVQSGQLRRAVEIIERVSTAEVLTSDQLYNCGCVMALAAAALIGDSELHERYAARAVELLGRIEITDFDRAQIDFIRQDADLDCLRQRADFRELMTRLEAGGTDERSAE